MSFLLTDIVTGEVKAHITRDAEEATRNLAGALAVAERRWKVQKLAANAKAVFDYEQDASLFAEQRFADFEKATGLTLLRAADYADMTKVIQAYFSVTPPFEKKTDKKHEFPDALALSEIEGWAKEKDTLVLVVSRDGGWHRYAEESDRLVAVTTPRDAYRLFNRADNHVARRVVDELANGNAGPIPEAIDTALQSFAEGLWPHVDASTAYHYEVELEGLSFESRDAPQHDDAVILDSNENTVGVAIPLTVHLKAFASFTFMIKDEGEYFPIGHASVERDVEIDVVVTATVLRSGTELDISDVDVETSRYSSIDFGTVEPDWEDDSPDSED